MRVYKYFKPKKGTIVLWYGASSAVPVGWAICDGSNGTPDLRGKYVIGADGVHTVGANYGYENHSHGIIDDLHTHGIETGTGLAGGTAKQITSSLSNVAFTDSANNYPPSKWYWYIMKL